MALDNIARYPYIMDRHGLVTALDRALDPIDGGSGGLFLLDHRFLSHGIVPAVLDRVHLPDVPAVTGREHNQLGWFQGDAMRGQRRATAALGERLPQPNQPHVAGQDVGNKYTPMDNGPLPSRVSSTFRGGTYTELVTQGNTILYRVYGEKARELGPYWTTTKPQGPLQSVFDRALDQNWGNTATNITTIKVPQGTTIYHGYDAAQCGLVGGGIQVYIPEVNPLWIAN